VDLICLLCGGTKREKTITSARLEGNINSREKEEQRSDFTLDENGGDENKTPSLVGPNSSNQDGDVHRSSMGTSPLKGCGHSEKETGGERP